MLIYIIIYWLFGMLFWPFVYIKTQKSFTLTDLFLTAVFTSWLWPAMLLCFLWVKGQDIILLKASKSNGDCSNE